MRPTASGELRADRDSLGRGTGQVQLQLTVMVRLREIGKSPSDTLRFPSLARILVGVEGVEDGKGDGRDVGNRGGHGRHKKGVGCFGARRSCQPRRCHSSLRGVTKKWGTEAELWLPLIAI